MYSYHTLSQTQHGKMKYTGRMQCFNDNLKENGTTMTPEIGRGNVMIWPVTKYGQETLTLKEQDKLCVKTFEMKEVETDLKH